MFFYYSHVLPDIYDIEEERDLPQRRDLDKQDQDKNDSQISSSIFVLSNKSDGVKKWQVVSMCIYSQVTKAN